MLVKDSSASETDFEDYQRPMFKKPMFLKANDWMNISETFNKRIMKNKQVQEL